MLAGAVRKHPPTHTPKPHWPPTLTWRRSIESSRPCALSPRRAGGRSARKEHSWLQPARCSARTERSATEGAYSAVCEATSVPLSLQACRRCRTDKSAHRRAPQRQRTSPRPEPCACEGTASTTSRTPDSKAEQSGSAGFRRPRATSGSRGGSVGDRLEWDTSFKRPAPAMSMLAEQPPAKMRWAHQQLAGAAEPSTKRKGCPRATLSSTIALPSAIDRKIESDSISKVQRSSVGRHRGPTSRDQVHNKCVVHSGVVLVAEPVNDRENLHRADLYGSIGQS